ncbi:MAG: ferrochelatase [Solirubrobacteraceae bacterium]
MTQTAALLLLAYGTPTGPEDIEPYYTHIRHGRPPTPELLAELTERYQAIGGVSPLLQIARDQAQGVAELLKKCLPDTDVHVLLGMKHAHPFIEEAVAELASLSVERALALVLAPHYSTMSVAEYQQRVTASAQQHGGLDIKLINEWHLEPGYIAMLGRRVQSQLTGLRGQGAKRIRTLFTAHSLPTRILETGDPYPQQLQETAQAVAQMLGLDDWGVGWQSAGRTSDPWIGPDICEVIRDLGADGQHDGVLVCPAGFVSDHLEVLYDLDIQAREVAHEVGLGFARTPSPNADTEFVEVLAQLASTHLGEQAA